MRVKKEPDVREKIHVGKNKNILIFCIVLLIQCLVIVAWGTQKERMHVDEMFTMEGAKQKGAGIRYWDLAEDFYGTEHNREEFQEHLTVNHDDLLIRDGAACTAGRLLKDGVFYYTIINVLSSVYPGHIPWHICVGFNLVCFIIAQLVLYLFAKEEFGEVCAFFTIAFYGFSAGAVSTVLYARCYMMLTMYMVLLIYIYQRFIKSNRVWQKSFCLVGSALTAFLACRTHQFGTILFILITGMAVLYMLINKKWNALLWLAAGYGIPGLLGSLIIWDKLRSFFTGGVADVFYSYLKNTSVSSRLSYIMELLNTVADHMFGNMGIMLLVAAAILFYLVHIKIWRRDSALQHKLVVLGFLLIVVAYYLMLVLGGAVAWRYFNPVYPMIALLLGVAASLFYMDSGMSKRVKIMVAAVGICIPLVSYGSHHVSEMYSGEKARREELETKYHGVNGIMVHHDSQGEGENWLYEAATLWPEESEVLIIQNRMLYEEQLCYNRTDNKILLWLTVDYDNEEALSRFRELTDYTDIELVMTTDSLRIFECNK